MRVCFVVRSVFTQSPTYTTTHLAFEALRRGHQVFYTTINSLSSSDTQGVLATVIAVRAQDCMTREALVSHLKSQGAEKREVSLSEIDCVFFRYNPNEPDGERDKGRLALIEFGRLLKAHGTFVVNDPVGLSRASSKMYLSHFPSEIRAETLITRSAYKVKEFIKKLKRPAIVKPLSGFGGQDVFYIKNYREININQIISAVSKSGYVLVQAYLPQVKKGDKRLLLLNGEPMFFGKQAAMYKRMSPKGEIRSNIHIGGTRREADWTKSDSKIVEAIRSKLVSDGLYFVGADIVGDKLLEVNVFCPGGINNINELYGINVGARVIQDLEARVWLWKHGKHTDTETRALEIVS